MSERKESLRDALVERLLGTAGKDVTTSALGRLRRTAGTALRGGRALLTRGEAPLELDALGGLVERLGELRGLAMKMGQMASYIDVSLPGELREALSVLQTHAPPMPPERVRALLTEELGERATELLAHLEERPLAAASIGQVHRARLADGTAVAVKVQYPGIDRAIEADFGTAQVGARFASLLVPGASVDALVHEARERFLAECDYLREARTQARMGALFAGHPVLRIPAVHERLCSRRVLVTTLVEGEGLDAFLAHDPPQQARDRLGEALFEFYVGALFRHGLYNCDPHPGNYLFRADGTLAMLDYGCVREFEAAFVRKLAGLTRAAHQDTRKALHAAFVELGMVRPGQRYDFAAARDLVRGFYGPMLHDRTQAVDLGEALDLRRAIHGKRQLMKLSLPGEFFFLLRIRFGLMGVLARLGARANWYRLEEAYTADVR